MNKTNIVCVYLSLIHNLQWYIYFLCVLREKITFDKHFVWFGFVWRIVNIKFWKQLTKIHMLPFPFVCSSTTVCLRLCVNSNDLRYSCFITHTIEPLHLIYWWMLKIEPKINFHLNCYFGYYCDDWNIIHFFLSFFSIRQWNGIFLVAILVVLKRTFFSKNKRNYRK